eukprot:scaffold22791_cov64-Attheya_sp.AAC.2
MKYHGIKSQIITAPIGIIVNVWGPGSLRDNDIWYMNESEVDEYLVSLQPEARANLRAFFSCLTDCIYPFTDCLMHLHEAPINGVLTQQQEKENVAMKGMREPVEWPFAGLKVTFGIMQTSMIRWRLLNKNRERNDIPFKQYRVCCLFYNLRVCASGGSNVSNFFGGKPPTLDEYLSFLNTN